METPPTQCGRPGAASASRSLGQRGFDGWGHVSVNSGGCAGPATRELRRRRDGLQHQGPWTASRPPAKGLRVQLPAASRSVPCARTCAGHFGSGAAGIPSSLLCLTLSTVTATWVACLWKVAEHLVKPVRTLSWFCGDTMAGLKVGGPRFAPMPPDREACRKDARGAWAAEGGRPGIPETDAASPAATRR